MNISDTRAQIKTRQLSLAELVTGAFAFFVSYFKHIFIIALAVYVPVHIAQYLSRPLNQRAVTWAQGMLDKKIFDAVKPLIDVPAFVSGFITIIASMAITSLINDVIEERPADTGAALRQALLSWPVAFAATVLSLFMIGAGLLALIIPGIICAIWFSFITEAVVLRSVGPLDALRYSFRLVKGRWLLVFSTVLFLSMVSITINLLVMIPFTTVPDTMLWFVFSQTLLAVFVQYIAAAGTLFFLNLDHTRSTEL